MINDERTNVIVKAGGHIVANAGIDGDRHAVPVCSTVSAELDVSQGPLGRKDRQHLDFIVVDVDARVSTERAAEMTYSLELASLSGGSIDRDGEDGTDDSEKLSRKKHDAS